MTPEPSPAFSRRTWLVVGLGVAVFTLVQTLVLSWKAAGLMPEWGFDLNFFHNLVWNTAHGNGWIQTSTYHEPPGIFGETHFEPILLLAVPPYVLFQHVETLFFMQSLVLGLGAFGVYRVARSGRASELASYAAAAVYLGWWPLWRMAQADIRPLTWSIPFLILLVAALREERRMEALGWAFLACICREEVPLLVVATAGGHFGLAWITKDAARRSTAVRVAAAAVVFFVVTTLLRTNTTFYIQPEQWLASLTSNDAPSAADQWGRDAGEMWSHRLSWFGEWLIPVGIGALAAPEILLGGAPLLVYLLTQGHEWATWEGPYIHHTASLVGILAAASALGWVRLLGALRGRGKVLGPVAAAVVLVFVASEGRAIAGAWEPYLHNELTPWRTQEPRVLEAHRLADQIPKDAAAMAGYDLVHLISGRRWVYCYQQEEIANPAPPASGLTDPLLPPAEMQPQWAIIAIEHEPWVKRATAAGLQEVDRGDEWVLFGPP